jgi:hypothetical protein
MTWVEIGYVVLIMVLCWLIRRTSRRNNSG